MQQAGIENDLTPLADCSSCNYRDTLLAAGACKPGNIMRLPDRIKHAGFAPSVF